MKQEPKAPARRSRWGQARRLEFIDVRLRWDGRLNRSDLTEFFDISVPQASLDLAGYAQQAPANLRYDASSKSYVATESFRPIFAAEEPQRYLYDLMAINTGVLKEDQIFLGWLPNFDSVPMLDRGLDSRIFFPLIRAIRERAALRVSYQSMSHDDADYRTISPHALAFDGFRWHVRAYCHARLDYRDFVIARILEISAVDEVPISGDQDEKWHQVITLVLAPNPLLSEAQQRAIARDYGMEAGVTQCGCRRSLLFYALRRLGLAGSAAENKKSQQLVLANRDEIQMYLDEIATS